ncbi:hypothetical protein Gotur_032527 [Gossypium turneri]
MKIDEKAFFMFSCNRASLQKPLSVHLLMGPLDGLQGAAVTLTELGDYARATSLLQELVKVKTSDPEVFRLLGEVKYELKDYDGSAAAYKLSAAVSKDVNFEVLHGYTNALLAAKRPAEAVQFLLSCRERLNIERSTGPDPMAESSKMETEPQNLDPIQVSWPLHYQLHIKQSKMSVGNFMIDMKVDPLIEGNKTIANSVDQPSLSYISNPPKPISTKTMAITTNFTPLSYSLTLFKLISTTRPFH